MNKLRPTSKSIQLRFNWLFLTEIGEMKIDYFSIYKSGNVIKIEIIIWNSSMREW